MRHLQVLYSVLHLQDKYRVRLNNTVRQNNMTAIDRALRGRRIQSFRIAEHSVCMIYFDGDYVLTSETLLRFVGTCGEFITADDHNQQFGLPGPFDAEAAISKEIVGKDILRIEVCQNTGDLHLWIDGGVIEVIASSSGYESFQLAGAVDWIMVVVGGKQQAESGRGGRIAPATPPTPPGMRLRTGRFQSDSLGD